MSKQNYYPTISQIYDYGVGFRAGNLQSHHHHPNPITPIDPKDILEHNKAEMKLQENFVVSNSNNNTIVKQDLINKYKKKQADKRRRTNQAVQNKYPTISQDFDYGVGVNPMNKNPEIRPIRSEDIQRHNLSEGYKEGNVRSLDFDNLKNLTSPDVWGPHYWFVFHNASANYPTTASPYYAERMKNFILSIPVLLPCLKCKEDSTAYIDSRKSELDTIVSGRENLFNFFVDFHNMVNKKHNKRSYSYDEIKVIYMKK